MSSEVPKTPSDPRSETQRASDAQSHYLSVLAAAPPTTVKALAETLLAALPDVTVVYNRTGLVMLPYVDSVAGETFHLGEALVAEARVCVHGQEGYAACLGRDLEQSLALALVDAVMQGQAPIFSAALRREIARVVDAESAAQQQADQELLQKVEATRVELETF